MSDSVGHHEIPEQGSVSRMAERRLFSRRRWLSGMATMSLTGCGLYGWATHFEPHWLEVTRHTLKIRNLPSSLEGKTLVQISDLHIGSTDESYLTSVMERVNDLQPDLLVITGDVIDHHFPEHGPVVERVLSTLAPAKITSLACLGNHDYGRHWRQLAVANEVTRVDNDCGIRVLRDEQVDVEGLNIVGMEDLWSPNFDSRRTLENTESEQPSLALCHNPDVCDRMVWGEFQGIILSGHTHGGQCHAPFIGPPRLPVQNRRYVGGFYPLEGARTLYVNRGLGYGYKARFNCRPELTEFRLTA
jgi:predicted MPP superfamily phosphohydrolase